MLCSESSLRKQYLISKPRTKRKKSERSYMTNTLRYLVLEKSGGRCCLCGRSVADGALMHIDHIVPVSKGGKTEISNLRVLCDQCNNGKSDIVPFVQHSA